ncbi:hypothetical protein BH11MYX4_BH11MYX4_07270 [soil metagenome]
MATIRPLALLPLLLTALVGSAACTATPPDDDDQFEQDEGELKALPASSVLGMITYGETKKVTVATAAYRALSFTGKAGDEVNADLLASAAKLDGMWITTAKFANLAVSLATAGSPRLSATAKLPADGTYYVVFRQRTSAAVTHEITLKNNVAKPDVGFAGFTKTSITTGSDGLAKVSFPGIKGARFRVSLLGGTVSEARFSAARFSGCTTQDVWVGGLDFAATDVTVTSTATCTLSVGPSERAIGVVYQIAIVRLDDPERAAYVKSLECDGPELPLSSLAAAMPQGANRLALRPRDGLRGRTRTCHPVTGCSPYRAVPSGYSSYLLFANDQELKLAFDRQQSTTMKVRVGAGCLSLSSDAADVNGTDDVVRFDLPAAPRTPEGEPTMAAVCSGPPLTEAQMAGLFAPGTSERNLDLPTETSHRSCNRVTGCTAWAPKTSSTSNLSFQIDVHGKTFAHWGRGWQPMQGGQIMLKGVAIGKVTGSCIDLTDDSESPSGANDGNYEHKRDRKVGLR